MSKLGMVIVALVGLMAVLTGCLGTQPGQQQAQGGFDWTLLGMMALIFAVFYFLMIRPQRKKQKRHTEMMQQLRRGDRVITAGGIYGEIDAIDEETILLKVESGATLRLARNAVVGIRPK